MRVRWVVQDSDRPGGVESVVRRLNAGLIGRGVDSAVFSWLPMRLDDVRETSSRVWFRAKLTMARERNGAARRAADTLREELLREPDSVAILDPGSLPVARYLAGIPRWGLHMHWHPDVILRPWRHLQGDRVPLPLTLLVSARMRAVGRQNARILDHAPFLVTLTESHTATFRRMHHHVHQIANPVDCIPFEPPAGGETVTVGYVGRLSHEKGPDVLIEALASSPVLRQTEVVVAGAGPIQTQIMRRADDLGLRHVQFLGWVEDTGAVLRHIDVMVLPSRAEGVPLVVIEALAAGCRVVAADAGSGVRDLLRGGQLGTIVPVGDAAALGAAIEAAVADAREGRLPDQYLIDDLVTTHYPELVLDAWVDLLREETASGAATALGTTFHRSHRKSTSILRRGRELF